ncbi:mitochondrial ribosomal protein S5/S7 [Rhodofomes roseus]|uniref:Mitochondrial ribosomal protein S5/S7 n=1 Tax=Rhodofomes roseus TaxID=34475 RepID=A0ABQ8KE04_9APHY|nr:mitochondrial ribosomal protein S5/S7 [Rhodofomes roseus]KAH9835354.1 mitochondrial ribosomal protein S5/S7 [Rhodofomes roseus]
MLSGLRQSALRVRLTPRRGFTTSRVAENVTGATSSQASNDNGIVDRETLVPAAEPLPVAPSPAAPRKTLHPTPETPIYIPPQYDPLLELIAGCINWKGEKQRARKIVSETLINIHMLTRAPPLPILRKAVEYVSPIMRNITIKLPSKNAVYPEPAPEKQRMLKAIRWILEASKTRPGFKLQDRLAREMIAIVEGAGKENMKELSPAYRMKEEVHKLAILNRGNVLKSRRHKMPDRGGR